MFEPKNAVKGICYIIGAGECSALDFEKRGDDIVIAVDGGLDHLDSAAMTADIFVGDMDSVSKTPQIDNCIVLNKQKDFTDTFKAIQLGQEKGYANYRLYGCSGGRNSHTIANIQLLDYLAENGNQGYIISQNSHTTVIRNSMLRLKKQDAYVSVFCINGRAKGVTLRGFKYPLNDYEMEGTNPIGISNEIVDDYGEIEVKDGGLLIVIEKNNKFRQ